MVVALLVLGVAVMGGLVVWFKCGKARGWLTLFDFDLFSSKVFCFGIMQQLF